MEGNGMKKISFTKNPAPANTMFSSETASERNSESYFYFCSTEPNSELISLSRNGSEQNSESFLFRGTAGIPPEQTICSVYSVFRGIIFCRKLPTLNTHLNSSLVQVWEAACPCCSPSPPPATWASPTTPPPTPTYPTTWPVSPLLPFASQRRRNETGPSSILYQRYVAIFFCEYDITFEVSRCYHFCVIIFLVPIGCYHLLECSHLILLCFVIFSLLFFFLETWHTRNFRHICELKIRE